MFDLKFTDLENIYKITDFEQSDHVITITSADPLPDDTSGFTLSREGRQDRWDYSGFKTIYRKITSKEVQYSDDGSVYVPPTKDVIVQSVWNDGDDVYGARPESVDVQLYKNGKKTVIATLTAPKWKKSYMNRPVEDVFEIVPPDLPRYQKSISGTEVTYTIEIPQPREVTTEALTLAAVESYEGAGIDGMVDIYTALCEQNQRNFLGIPEEVKERVAAGIDTDGFMINEDGTVSLKPINLEVENE